MFLLVMSETLALFVDTLTADDKYSLCNRENLQQKIQVHLSKKKRFFRIFCSSSVTYIILAIFSNKMTLLAYLFSKLQTAKDVVRKMSKKLGFRTSLDI